MNRWKKIIDKLNKKYPNDIHMVQVDNVGGTDRIVRIQTSAPVKEVKSMFVEKHLFVSPIETSLDVDDQDKPDSCPF